MNRLSSKKSSWICVCIVAFMLITGMCFDEDKTHSLFLYSPGAKSHVTIISVSAVALEQQEYIPEMLQMERACRILTAFDGEDKENREEACFDVALEAAVLNEFGGGFRFLGFGVLLNIEVAKRIVNHAHRSDGKKRVCVV